MSGTYASLMVSVAGVRGRGGRSVVAVNGVVAATLIAVIAALALVVKPPAPPGIAEFAPQASKPITKAPQSQSSSSGTGRGACAVAGCGKPAGASPRPVQSALSHVAAGVPSALQCFDWPDGAVTQTFDPQSPPCIASWPGQAKGNGGATSAGVSATVIRLAYPKYSAGSSGSDVGYLQYILDFINSHFELYGRSIQLVPFDSQQVNETAGGNSDQFGDPQAQHADAIAASSLHVFAADDFLDDNLGTLTLPTYVDTLAAHKVVSIAGGEASPMVSAAEMAAHAPYEWSYESTLGSLLANTATMVCHQLVGHDASHASAYRTDRRSFAILLPEHSDTGGTTVDGLATLKSTLASCGVSDPPVIYYQSATNATTTALSASFVELKREGVTSLIYLPWLDSVGQKPEEVASSDGYHPEWITMGWLQNTVAGIGVTPTSNLDSTFGVASWNKLSSPEELPWEIAYSAANGPSLAGASVQSLNGFYHEVLLLASGVQMAGPDLTPATLAAALHSTAFPNPGAGAAPSYQAAVGFGATETMMSDFVGFWYDTSSGPATELADEPDEDYWQIFCYVDLGTRFSNDAWPRTDRFYQGACR